MNLTAFWWLQIALGGLLFAGGLISAWKHRPVPVSLRVQQALNQLKQNALAYEGNGYPQHKVAKNIELICSESSTLMERLRLRGTPEQLKLVQSQYAVILEKTAQLTAPDYLKDMMENPQYWQGAEQRISEIQEVLVAVPTQITRNIRQVNSAADLDFQTALAVLNLITEQSQHSDTPFELES